MSATAGRVGLLYLFIAGCFSFAESPTPAPASDKTSPSQTPSTAVPEIQSSPLSKDSYHFLDESDSELISLESRFSTPEGYRRVGVQSGSFASWLRGLPLQNAENTVYAFDGRQISAPSAGVVPLGLGRGDIQQCADSILRLYAEYRWDRGDADQLGFHFTSGDFSGWKKWRMGERFRVKGSKVGRVQKNPVSNDHSEYRKWLHHTFMYAGTRSLRMDSASVKLNDEIQAGDFFVTPGSPGHAIIVLDTATSKNGPPIALLGQGFMPAQDFHVLTDDGGHMVGDWFVLPQTSDESLNNPSWTPIPRTSVLRFPK
jgi:hypothetical protein